MQPLELPGRPGSPFLLVADHASAHVPPEVALGIAPELLTTHIAVDLGIEALTRSLSRLLGAPAILAPVSRLVVDVNRAPDEPAAIPVRSDGHAVPGNKGLGPEARAERIGAYHLPYHAALSAAVERLRPGMIVGLHSFTPQLATRPHEVRPWPVALLYNAEERAARLAIADLAAAGLHVGDNAPYSGRQLNYTMNRHAEARAIPYLNFEVRQDELGDAGGVERWARTLAATIRRVAEALSAGAHSP